MSAKSYSPRPQSSTSSSTTEESVAPTADFFNSENIEALQRSGNIAEISTSNSWMVGDEMDWLQDWLEEGPQPLEDIQSGRIGGIPNLVLQESKYWDNGTVQGGVSGTAQLSGKLRASGSGNVSATSENARADASGSVHATPNSLSASGTASGAVEQDGNSLRLSASGSADSSGHTYGQVGATLGHEGQIGDIQHSAQSSGTIDSNGIATLDGSVGGSVAKGDNSASVSANGTLNNKGLMKGKLLGQFNHNGSTGDLDHSLRSSGSIDSSGKTNMSVKGRIGSSNTVEDGDSTVTTSTYLGAGAELERGMGGEVGMMRKSVTDGEMSLLSAGASVDQKGSKLSIANRNIRDKSRDSTELSFTGNHDGSSMIKLGGDASAELWRKSEVLAPGVSATARALGGGLGAGMSFTREADGSASLGANAKASLILGEGIVYAEREVAEFGDFGADWDGRLRAAAEATGDAKASIKLDKGMAVEAALKAFIGAKAEASTGMTLTWDRKDDYGPMLEDFANNLPGTWDDELLDRLPDEWWTNVGTILFGKGKSDLLRVGVGVDARAGAGAEASITGGVSESGMFQTEVKAGAALGVGGGARFQFGFNPIDLLRRSLADGIEAVNESFNYAEVMWRYATDVLGGSSEQQAEVIETASEEAQQNGS